MMNFFDWLESGTALLLIVWAVAMVVCTLVLWAALAARGNR